jgi:hypothetical protein
VPLVHRQSIKKTVTNQENKIEQISVSLYTAVNRTTNLNWQFHQRRNQSPLQLKLKRKISSIYIINALCNTKKWITRDKWTNKVHNKANSMEWNASSEAKSSSSACKFLHIYGTKKFFVCLHISSPLVYILSLTNLVNRVTICFWISILILSLNLGLVWYMIRLSIHLLHKYHTNIWSTAYKVRNHQIWNIRQFISIKSIKIFSYYKFRNPNTYVNPTFGN